jgi:Nif-specific regulatory protein
MDVFYFYDLFNSVENVAADLSDRNANRAGGVKQLALLAEIGNALSGAAIPRTAFERVLEMLHRDHGVVRGTVTLLDRKSAEVRVEVSHGLTEAGKIARYRLGEGITGRVVESGKPIVVPQVSREPMFLNRGQRKDLHKQDLTFICVPIVVSGKPVGALGIDLHFEKNRDYESELKFLGILSAMMAQAVKSDHLVDDERRRLMDENTHLLEELKERYDFSNIIGTTGPMRQVYEQIAQVAHSNTTVLIRGESGTGKELIAHAIHYNSPRAQKPFIKVSCAALPESLIESELFGYEKGAFTGAHAQRKAVSNWLRAGLSFSTRSETSIHPRR